MNWDQVEGMWKRFTGSAGERWGKLAGASKAEDGKQAGFDKEWKPIEPALTRIADFWCRLMHTEPMWPSHGQYECRTCGRRQRVCWEQPSLAMAPAMVSMCETEVQGALARATEPRIRCSW